MCVSLTSCLIVHTHLSVVVLIIKVLTLVILDYHSKYL